MMIPLSNLRLTPSMGLVAASGGFALSLLDLAPNVLGSTVTCLAQTASLSTFSDLDKATHAVRHHWDDILGRVSTVGELSQTASVEMFHRICVAPQIKLLPRLARAHKLHKLTAAHDAWADKPGEERTEHYRQALLDTLQEAKKLVKIVHDDRSSTRISHVSRLGIATLLEGFPAGTFLPRDVTEVTPLQSQLHGVGLALCGLLFRTALPPPFSPLDWWIEIAACTQAHSALLEKLTSAEDCLTAYCELEQCGRDALPETLAAGFEANFLAAQLNDEFHHAPLDRIEAVFLQILEALLASGLLLDARRLILGFCNVVHLKSANSFSRRMDDAPLVREAVVHLHDRPETRKNLLPLMQSLRDSLDDTAFDRSPVARAELAQLAAIVSAFVDQPLEQAATLLAAAQQSEGSGDEEYARSLYRRAMQIFSENGDHLNTAVAFFHSLQRNAPPTLAELSRGVDLLARAPKSYERDYLTARLLISGAITMELNADQLQRAAWSAIAAHSVADVIRQWEEIPGEKPEVPFHGRGVELVRDLRRVGRLLTGTKRGWGRSAVTIDRGGIPPIRWSITKWGKS